RAAAATAESSCASCCSATARDWCAGVTGVFPAHTHQPSHTSRVASPAASLIVTLVTRRSEWFMTIVTTSGGTVPAALTPHAWQNAFSEIPCAHSVAPVTFGRSLGGGFGPISTPSYRVRVAALGPRIVAECGLEPALRRAKPRKLRIKEPGILLRARRPRLAKCEPDRPAHDPPDRLP